jgi:hypothetical protein
MDTQESSIHAKRFAAEQKRRKLSRIELMIHELSLDAVKLDRGTAAEEESAGISPEREAKRMRKDEIDNFMRPLAADCIAELEEGLEKPESKVPTALLAELIEHYGVDAARAAIAELRI